MGVAQMAGSILFDRDVIQDVKTAPQTFSSWHNCMQKAYCKWPAIIGIAIGSLIVLSIVWCLARCLCCGLSCCCSCLSCLDCCSRGDRHNHGGSKYADGPSPFQNNSYQGYQPAPAPPSYEPPRFAQFDAPSKGGKFNGDALPAMPSWDQAASRKIEDSSHEDVELAHLDRHNDQMNGTIPHQGATGRGGYSEVPSAPPTPHLEQPLSYRGSEITNPYGSAPAPYGSSVGAAAAGGVAGGLAGAAYSRPSPVQGQHPAAHEMDPGQGYARMSPPPPQNSYGYGEGRTGSPYTQIQPPTQAHSPYNEVPPHFPNSYPSNNSQAPREVAGHSTGGQSQSSYAAYTPSNSTQYEPSNSPPAQQAGYRPPSLLTPGRKPAPQW